MKWYNLCSLGYCETLNRLTGAARCKGCLNMGVILCIDKAPAHSADWTKEMLHRNGSEILRHPTTLRPVWLHQIAMCLPGELPKWYLEGKKCDCQAMATPWRRARLMFISLGEVLLWDDCSLAHHWLKCMVPNILKWKINKEFAWPTGDFPLSQTKILFPLGPFTYFLDDPGS